MEQNHDRVNEYTLTGTRCRGVSSRTGWSLISSWARTRLIRWISMIRTVRSSWRMWSVRSLSRIRPVESRAGGGRTIRRRWILIVVVIFVVVRSSWSIGDGWIPRAALTGRPWSVVRRRRSSVVRGPGAVVLWCLSAVLRCASSRVRRSVVSLGVRCRCLVVRRQSPSLQFNYVN